MIEEYNRSSFRELTDEEQLALDACPNLEGENQFIAVRDEVRKKLLEANKVLNEHGFVSTDACSSSNSYIKRKIVEINKRAYQKFSERGAKMFVAMHSAIASGVDFYSCPKGDFPGDLSILTFLQGIIDNPTPHIQEQKMLAQKEREYRGEI